MKHIFYCDFKIITRIIIYTGNVYLFVFYFIQKDVIKDHPDVLTLVLKRFEFNYNCMSYIKINCFVKVPFTVQIPEVCIQFILLFNHNPFYFTLF